MSDYSGNTVDLEVARYGLRTFRAVRKSKVDADPMIEALFFGKRRRPGPYDDPSDPLTLCPVTMIGSHWADGTCEAQCLDGAMTFLSGRRLRALLLGDYDDGPHTAPHEYCHCGIYATLSLEHLNKQYGNYAKNIVAVIAAEGQTIIGDRGFRTQYARVTAYWCEDKLAPVAKRQFRDATRYTVMSSMLRDYRLHNNDPVKDLEEADI